MGNRSKKRKKTAQTANFLRAYRLGVDFWGLGLFGVLFILNLACWCALPNVYFCNASSAGMYAAAYVLQAVACLILTFVRHEDEGRDPNFSSALFLFFAIAVLLSVVSWIFYLAQYLNWAVLIFLAVFPTAAVALLACMRRNWFALVPAAVSFALWLALVIPMMA